MVKLSEMNEYKCEYCLQKLSNIIEYYFNQYFNKLDESLNFEVKFCNLP